MHGFADVSKKATQKARETAEKSRETAEETVSGAEQSYSSAIDNIRNLNVTLIDAAQANFAAGCAFARDMTTVKTPSDLVGAWTSYAQRQFDMATKQASDLTALGQKFAAESTGPLGHSFRQAFARATT